MTEIQQLPITRFSVFVPGAFPQHSYVRRTFRHRRTGEVIDPELLIAEALSQPGIIAQVVGPSKSGKTRAIENCVGIDRLVTIAGSQLTPDTTLWEVVVRQLKAPIAGELARTAGTTWGTEMKVSASAEIPLVAVETELSGSVERSAENEETLNFETDPFQAAIGALRRQRKVLFLDDFHTIPDECQPQVAAQLKAAAQFGLKICLAEVPHHSDSTISALPDLTGRVHKIEFQYWNAEDLLSIGQVGFEKLQATIAPAALDAFAMEAAGSPQLMQMICLNAAGSAKIEARLPEPTSFQFELPEIRSILLHTHATVDRERIFALLDQGPDERGNPRNRYPVRRLGTGDNYEIALAAICLSPPATSLTWNNGLDNISRRIDRVCTDPNDKPQKGQVTRALEQMQTLAEKHMPRQPILEWNPATGLQILDPYFLFHLRWSEKYEQIRVAAATT